MVAEIYSYTGADIATDVKDKFGDIGAVQITDAAILRWINQGIASVASRNPFLKKKATRDLVAGQSVYALPGSSDMMQFEMALVDGSPLKFLPFPEFEKVTTDISLVPTGQVPGVPSHYTEYAGDLMLYPTPSTDIADGILIYYAAYPAKIEALTDTLTVPDRFFNALRDYVHAQALELDDDYSASQIKMSHHEAQIAMQLGKEDKSPTDYYPTVTDLTYVEDRPIDDYYRWV